MKKKKKRHFENGTYKYIKGSGSFLWRLEANLKAKDKD
jgi:hypothetical protein